MTQDNNEKDFHEEIDDAIDNLFGPYAGNDEATPEIIADAQPTSETSDPDVTFQVVEQTDDITKVEEALLSLEWEISAPNIEKARTALKDLQQNLATEKATSLAEVFSLMDQIFEAMAVAPQNVPTSAPKTLKEGLQAIQTTAQTDDLVNIEQNLIDPTLSELRSALPNIPKDYSKILLKSEVNPIETAEPAAEPESHTHEEPTEPETDTLTFDLPEQQSQVPTILIETINGHISILDKCIAKRIVPIENLFGKTPGYEKLHAIHKELHQRMDKQKQILINALGADYLAGAAPPADCPPQPKVEPAASPWQTIVTTTWEGQTVAFIPEQIAYDGIPNKAPAGPFLPLKNLKKGMFGKITSVVKGALNFYNESTLKDLQVPIARATNTVSKTPDSTENVVILFNDNSGMAFYLGQPLEVMEVSSAWTWTPNYDPNTMTAGELTNQDQIISIITIRNL